MAGVLLLAKVKKEGLGKLYTWVAYLVIIVSLLMLICQGTRAVLRMACHREDCMPEGNCMPGMMHRECDRGGCMMMRHGWMGGHMRGGEEMEMEMCKTKMDSGCCDMKGNMKGKMHGGCPMDMEEKEEVKTDAPKK